MTEFIKGKELCRDFFHQIAQPCIARHFPRLRYSSGLLGYGSDILGYDDPVSTDHMWGPRFYLFLQEQDEGLQPQLEEIFSREFPYQFRGYSVHFSPPDPNDAGVRHAEPLSQGRVNPLVFFYTVDSYLDFYLGTHQLEQLTSIQWLSLSEHRLLALSLAEFYTDQLHMAQRLEKIRYYPQDVWLYLLASNWYLAAEEQAFVKRCGSTGDELGSALACSRIADRLMRLGFLYCKRYAPYSKWFGRAFQELPLPQDLKEAVKTAVLAGSTQQREQPLVYAQQRMAHLHNQLGLTEPVSEEIVPYFGRDISVIFADRIAQAIRRKLVGTPLEKAPLIGTLSQVPNFTNLYEDVGRRPQVEQLYR